MLVPPAVAKRHPLTVPHFLHRYTPEGRANTGGDGAGRGTRTYVARGGSGWQVIDSCGIGMALGGRLWQRNATRSATVTPHGHDHKAREAVEGASLR